LILLALPFASRADENLVAKREACRQEARGRIAPVGKIGIEEYRRIVERRNAYVSQCMTRVAVAHKDLPLPPKRVLDDAPEGNQVSLVIPVKEKSRRLAKRVERKKLKVVSLKFVKGKSLKGKKLKRLARRSK